MNIQNSSKDIETKLAEDTSGNYKKWLLNELRKHKKQFDEFKIGMLPANEYKKIEYMSCALDAAIGIIESKESGRDQDDAFNNIF